MNYFRRIALLPLAVVLFSGLLAAEDLIHMVGRGETIYSISRFYSVNADDLMKANNLSDPSKLQAGSRLKIPASASASQAPAQQLSDYRVVRGDTLYSIARTSGTSLQNLLDINKFSANHVIKIGDVIKVPSHSNTATVRVTSQNPGAASGTANNSTAAGRLASQNWPVKPKDIAYMTGQMGVVVEGEYAESVRSLTQGNVISAGPWRKFGRVVIVETVDGYFYMYGGCDTLSVNAGDRISPGTEVGRLGINAVSEKPQLFFMVFRNDTPVDPALAPRAASGALNNNKT